MVSNSYLQQWTQYQQWLLCNHMSHLTNCINRCNKSFFGNMLRTRDFILIYVYGHPRQSVNISTDSAGSILYVKLYSANYPTHCIPVTFSFTVDITYVSGLLSVRTLKLGVWYKYHLKASVIDHFKVKNSSFPL